MDYTYDDFLKNATDSGLLADFDADDLMTAQKHPEYGMSMLSLKNNMKNATTDEQKLLISEAASQLRDNYYRKDNRATNGYNSLYVTDIDQLLDKATGQSSFKWDPSTDQDWSAYRKAYLREGDRAAENTLAAAANASAGRPSSYAVTAASQANDYYKEKLADLLPNLRSMKLTEWNNDFANTLQRLAALRDQDATDYARYLDELNLKYQKERDAADDKQQQYANALSLYSILGGSSPAWVLEALGINGAGGAAGGGTGAGGGSYGGYGINGYGDLIDPDTGMTAEELQALQDALNNFYSGNFHSDDIDKIVSSGILSTILDTNGNPITDANGNALTTEDQQRRFLNQEMIDLFSRMVRTEPDAEGNSKIVYKNGEPERYWDNTAADQETVHNLLNALRGLYNGDGSVYDSITDVYSPEAQNLANFIDNEIANGTLSERMDPADSSSQTMGEYLSEYLNNEWQHGRLTTPEYSVLRQNMQAAMPASGMDYQSLFRSYILSGMNEQEAAKLAAQNTGYTGTGAGNTSAGAAGAQQQTMNDIFAQEDRDSYDPNTSYNGNTTLGQWITDKLLGPLNTEGNGVLNSIAAAIARKLEGSQAADGLAEQDAIAKARTAALTNGTTNLPGVTTVQAAPTGDSQGIIGKASGYVANLVDSLTNKISSMRAAKEQQQKEAEAAAAAAAAKAAEDARRAAEAAKATAAGKATGGTGSNNVWNPYYETKQTNISKPSTKESTTSANTAKQEQLAARKSSSSSSGSSSSKSSGSTYKPMGSIPGR